MRRVYLVLLLLGVFVAAAPSANALVYTLTDQNSSFQVDTAYPPQYLQWWVDGTYQLYEQGFWWRVGAAGGEAALGPLAY